MSGSRRRVVETFVTSAFGRPRVTFARSNRAAYSGVERSGISTSGMVSEGWAVAGDFADIGFSDADDDNTRIEVVTQKMSALHHCGYHIQLYDQDGGVCLAMGDKLKPDFFDWIGAHRIRDFNFDRARPLGSFLGFVLLLFSIITILSAIVQLIALLNPFVTHTSFTGTSPSFSSAALIAAILSAPLIIWRTILFQRQVKYQKEGMMTDRLAKAVDQLASEKTVKKRILDSKGKELIDILPSGKRRPLSEEVTEPNLEVRLGGILSLERILIDTMNYDDGRDYFTVVSILTAYLKQNAPARNLIASKDLSERKLRRSDLQMIIDVLKRRSNDQIRFEFERKFSIDLSYCDLSFLDLSGISLVGARLHRSRLEAALVDDADLRGAQVVGSLLNFCSFRNSNLTGVRFDGCEISLPVSRAGGFSLQFAGANLDGASFAGAKIPAVQYLSDSRTNRTFGTSDTELSFELDYNRSEAMRLKRERDFDEETSIFSRSQLDVFRYWQDYSATDLATGWNYKKLKDDLGLTQWPY